MVLNLYLRTYTHTSVLGRVKREEDALNLRDRSIALSFPILRKEVDGEDTGLTATLFLMARGKTIAFLNDHTIYSIA